MIFIFLYTYIQEFKIKTGEEVAPSKVDRTRNDSGGVMVDSNENIETN